MLERTVSAEGCWMFKVQHWRSSSAKLLVKGKSYERWSYVTVEWQAVYVVVFDYLNGVWAAVQKPTNLSTNEQLVVISPELD